MTITEFASLKLKAPYTVTSDPLPELFNLVRERQSAWSSYPLFYVTDTSDKSIVHILSGWDSVSAHEEWIKSDGNQDLLKGFASYLEDVTLRHLDVPFAKDRLNVPYIVYRNTPEGTEPKGKEADGLTTVSGQDLEHPDSGLHSLTFFEERPSYSSGDDKILERVYAEHSR
ncbi:hypothetical protein EST38_g5394 [Candolleomyces aberdarensis]|uniref:ABM domain-containing protein n=1 Tax=Candolleomyces aberdarensis TaxID=2316362 RepID=A0A4Q2DM97_9AGAR|nr:hypothetical protein EST38_g5394 [Candolleomyces aberdarensis]